MTKAQDQRSQSMKEQAYNEFRDQGPQVLTDKASIDLMKECHLKLTSGEIVSLINIESNNGNQLTSVVYQLEALHYFSASTKLSLSPMVCFQQISKFHPSSDCARAARDTLASSSPKGSALWMAYPVLMLTRA
ncbi:hypothetical protein Tco_1503605 [Tanacetum coccineum]